MADTVHSYMDTHIHEYKQGPNSTSWQIRSTLTWTLTSMNTNTSWQIWCTLTYMDTLIHEYKQGPQEHFMADTVHSYIDTHIHEYKQGPQEHFMADTVHSYMDTHIHEYKQGPNSTSWQIRSTLTWTLTSMNTNKGLTSLHGRYGPL